MQATDTGEDSGGDEPIDGNGSEGLVDSESRLDTQVLPLAQEFSCPSPVNACYLPSHTVLASYQLSHQVVVACLSKLW